MTSSSSTHDSPTLPNMELPALILISVNISWRNCLSLSSTSLENRYIIVDSLRYVHWFGRCTVFRVQRSLSVLDFDLKAVISHRWKRMIALKVSFSVCLQICLIYLLKYLSAFILAFTLYCRVSGQVPLSVCLFGDLIAPLAFLILSSVDRLWLWFLLSMDGLWRRSRKKCQNITVNKCPYTDQTQPGVGSNKKKTLVLEFWEENSSTNSFPKMRPFLRTVIAWPLIDIQLDKSQPANE